MSPGDIDSIPRSEIPKLIIALTARLLEPELVEPVSDEPDKLLTAAEASAILRRSRKWLSRNRRRLPFTVKLGERSWTHSEKGLRRWLARQK